MRADATRPARPDSTESWLSELKEAHEGLLCAIETLAQLTRGTVPDKGELAAARWRVSAASLSRRLIWGRIHSSLARRVTDLDVDRELRHLQQVDISLMRASAKHVGTWSLAGIIDDWAGYRQASKDMLCKMKEGISEEKRLLYPILSAIKSDELGGRSRG